jgi:endonuclease G, mitochondrial
VLLFIFLAVMNNAWANVEGVIGTPINQNQNLAVALPETINSEILISRDQYLISYNKNRRAPNWVAWKLEASQIGSSGRSNKFAEDMELEKYLTKSGGGFHAVLPTDFSKSCFDRGHQIPSGDRTDTATDNDATFMMSNMIPQTPYLNRVIWEHLENYTRELVQKQGKHVYVFAGPIYDKDFGKVGANKDIPVPSKDFKIIYVLNANQTAADINANTVTIAVIMPNTLSDGSVQVPYDPGCKGIKDAGVNSDDWKQYQTTLSDIESKSGIRFH